MTENQLISIIVPVYNTEKYLKECVDSLIEQSYENLEIILVDDGSTDNSPSLCDTFAEKDGRVRVIHKENGGVSAARNEGIKAANGEYIMFVDSDDWIDMDTCCRMYSAMKEYGVYVCKCCAVKEFQNRDVVVNVFETDRVFHGAEYEEVFFAALAGVSDERIAVPHQIDYFSSVCMNMYSRDIIADIRFTDLKEIGTAEDWLFQISVCAKLDKWLYINQPFYHYRKTNETSLTTKYKADLCDKWDKLYVYVANVLRNNGLYDKYEKNLRNKEALSFLQLGINEVHSPYGFFAQINKLKEIRNKERFEKAFKHLNITTMPFHWKLFFFLCKKKYMHGVWLMLCGIEFLRKRGV